MQLINFPYPSRVMLLLVCFSNSEWSAIEKEMGDGLQSAGHHMDV